MSKMHYVFSTLASAVNYQGYAKGGGDLPVPTEAIVIQGGANIPDKYMRTPDGAVVTPVTAEQLEALRQDQVFLLHEENGFIRVEDKNYEPEKVAADMTTRDNSAPLVESDFVEGNAPIVGRADEDDKPAGNKRRA